MIIIGVMITLYLLSLLRVYIMHFRVRGNSVQLVKTTEVSGKMTSAPAGSANLVNGELNETAQKALTDKEKAEVKSWLDARQALNRKDLEVKLAMLPEHLSELSKALKQGTIKMTDDEFKVVQASLRKLKIAAGLQKVS
jgi:hypothetical protein